MADNERSADRQDDQTNTLKDPSDWVTGDEPMTDAQRAFLQNLSERAGVPFDEHLSKAEASKRIDELRGQMGQGGGSNRDDASAGTSGQANAAKDPDQWVTGDEPMTGAQRSYLRTLAEEAGEPVDDSLTKSEASKCIDELQEKTGRGRE